MKYVELGQDNLRSHFVFWPRHAPEWLRARFPPVVFLANEEELTGKAFTTSLNTTNPNTYVKFIFLQASPLLNFMHVANPSRAADNLCTLFVFVLYSELALPRTWKILASLPMFLNLGKSRQRSSKGMFLSRTSRGRSVHACAKCFAHCCMLQIGCTRVLGSWSGQANWRCVVCLRGWGTHFGRVFERKATTTKNWILLTCSQWPSTLIPNLAHFT